MHIHFNWDSEFLILTLMARLLNFILACSLKLLIFLSVDLPKGKSSMILLLVLVEYFSHITLEKCKRLSVNIVH